MTEQQPYELIRRYPHFELRRYPDYVVAEVVVAADFDRAGNAAFRRLFNYITGSNTAREKLAMTAPVLQAPGTPHKLAMTAPVLQTGPLPGAAEADRFVVAFVLPAGSRQTPRRSPPIPRWPSARYPAPLPPSCAFPGGAPRRPSSAGPATCGTRSRWQDSCPWGRPGSHALIRPSSRGSCGATRLSRMCRSRNPEVPD